MVEGRTCLTKNSVLTVYLKGLRVNSNGPRMKRSWNFLNKLIREFLLSIFRSEALFGHPVPRGPTPPLHLAFWLGHT